MRVGLSDLLALARRNHAALGAFTCYDLETGVGVVRAAQQQGAPVVLLVGARALGEPAAGRALVAGLAELVHDAGVPACVELDHLEVLGAAEREALAAGATAAMVDGSRLDLASNVALVAEAVRVAVGCGAEVEGEIGWLEGDEDFATGGGRGVPTDPGEARRFADETGVACLAVSVGNVHGPYAGVPALDWRLLEELASTVAVPLVLHGASGLDPRDLARAIGCGVAKVNVNTDLRAVYFTALAAALPGASTGLDLLGMKRQVTEAVEGFAAEKLGALGWVKAHQASGRCSESEVAR